MIKLRKYSSKGAENILCKLEIWNFIQECDANSRVTWRSKITKQIEYVIIIMVYIDEVLLSVKVT